MAKMARCSACEQVIRKAEVIHVYRLGYLHAPLSRTTVHAECRASEPAECLDVDAPLDVVASALEAWGQRQQERRRSDEASWKQRCNELSDDLCWLRLESNRHEQHPCSPRCPVPRAKCSHAYNVADDGEFREHNELTDRVTCGRREAPQPLCMAHCNHMWC